MTTPLWRQPSSPIQRECDVAVIGAGIAGVSLALHLERQGKRVLIVDRHRLASGASGRNAGFLMRGAAHNYAACVGALGRGRARELWRMTVDNLQALLDEGIEALPSCAPTPSCLLALGDAEADQLRASHDQLREDGFPVELRTSGDDAPWASAAPIVGLVNPHDRTINPIELVHHLASKLARPPLEHVEISSIDAADDSEVILEGRGLAIRARQVALCTNAYTKALLPDVSPTVEPNRAQMLALRVDRRLLDFAYYVNHGGEYFRQVDDSTIIVGGMRARFLDRERTDQDETTPEIQSALEEFIGPLLGLEELDVIARWSGIMGFTPHHLPLAGATDQSGRVWICAGFNGHGMSLAFETARRTAMAMIGAGEAPFPLPGGRSVSGMSR